MQIFSRLRFKFTKFSLVFTVFTFLLVFTSFFKVLAASEIHSMSENCNKAAELSPETYPINVGMVIYSLDLNSNNILWRREFAGNYFLPMVWNSKNIFCLTDKGILSALDKTTGEILWQQKTQYSQGVSKLVLTEDRIIITPYSAFEISTGRKLWTHSCSNPTASFLLKKYLYFATGRNFVQLDATTGRLQTLYIHPEKIETLYLLNKRFFVTGYLSKRFVCLNDKGNLLWGKCYQLETVQHLFSDPQGENVFVSAYLNIFPKGFIHEVPCVISYEAATGKCLWKKYYPDFEKREKLIVFYDGQKIHLRNQDALYTLSPLTGQTLIKINIPMLRPLVNDYSALVKAGEILAIDHDRLILDSALRFHGDQEPCVYMWDKKTKKIIWARRGQYAGNLKRNSFDKWFLLVRSPNSIEFVDSLTGRLVRKYDLQPFTGLTLFGPEITGPEGYSGASFSPDGGNIAISKNCFRGYGILLYNLQGNLLNDIYIGPSNASLSPDFNKIFYWDQGLSQGSIKNIATNKEQVIPIKCQEILKSNISWAPDSQKIAFVDSDSSFSGNSRNDKIFWMDIKSGELHDFKAAKRLKVSQITYLPGGDTILFISRSSNEHDNLTLLDINSGKQIEIAKIPPNARLVYYSQNDKKIFYEAFYKRLKANALFEIGLNERNKKLLLEGENFIISPSGNKILFEHDKKLCLFDCQTECVRALTFENEPGQEKASAFFPSEDKILLISSVSGASQTYILDLNTLEKLPGQDNYNWLIKMKSIMDDS